jgi:hypothetical protein
MTTHPSAGVPGRQRRLHALAALVALAATSCTRTYDAGANLLPVDRRNPLVLVNDSLYDNWQGEYAVLLANSGGPRLVGIIVGAQGTGYDPEGKFTDWQDMVKAAHAAGLKNLPDPVKSAGNVLKRPASGLIDETVPNYSEGALFLKDLAKREARPDRPLVVATGGRLTDVADAYLIDPAIVDRVIVVSSLGTLTATGATMSNPNGEMDPWADTIVTSRLRYIQVSAYYDQTADIPAARVIDLPQNAFGDWMAAKQPGIWDLQEAADQVSILAAWAPGFVAEIERVSPAAPIDAGATAGPELTVDPDGPAWLVTRSNPEAARTAIWRILKAPETFGQ